MYGRPLERILCSNHPRLRIVTGRRSISCWTRWSRLTKHIVKVHGNVWKMKLMWPMRQKKGSEALKMQKSCEMWWAVKIVPSALQLLVKFILKLVHGIVILPLLPVLWPRSRFPRPLRFVAINKQSKSYNQDWIITETKRESKLHFPVFPTIFYVKH